jgi:DNA-binding MarR family transcriptional regulator
MNELDQCPCLALRKASRLITQRYDAELEGVGVKITQLPVLMAAGRGLPITRLAETLVMDRTTLTRNLQPLRRAGFVRVGKGADRRARVVTLTAKGEDALRRALPIWREAQKKMVVRIGRLRYGALMENLRATVTAARDK